MEYRQILSIIGIVLIGAVIFLIVIAGAVSVTEFFVAIVGALIVAAFAIAWWGFKEKIEGNTETDFYSPIHAMIVRVNNEVPREKALLPQNTVGIRVSASLIDFSGVSTIFNKHSDKFTDKDLKMWIEIEEETKRDNHFYLSNDRQKWFDDLEAKHHH